MAVAARLRFDGTRDMSGVGSNDGGAETGISSQEALESMYPRRDPHVTGRKRSMREYVLRFFFFFFFFFLLAVAFVLG